MLFGRIQYLQEEAASTGLNSPDLPMRIAVHSALLRGWRQRPLGMPKSTSSPGYYAGFANLVLHPDAREFKLGKGLVLRRIFARLMSSTTIALNSASMRTLTFVGTLATCSSRRVADRKRAAHG